MGYFLRAIVPVLQHEGGYANDPHDAGGETNFGICKRVYPHLDIKHLTREQAIEIYRRDYWRDYMDKISDYRVAAKLFDMSVNMGHGQANKIVQRAVGVTADGVFGPHTLSAVNDMEPDRLLKNIITEQLEFYDNIVERKPDQIVFLKTWTRRAGWVPSEVV